MPPHNTPLTANPLVTPSHPLSAPAPAGQRPATPAGWPASSRERPACTRVVSAMTGTPPPALSTAVSPRTRAAASGCPRRHRVITRVHPCRPGNDQPPAAYAFQPHTAHERAPSPPLTHRVVTRAHPRCPGNNRRAAASAFTARALSPPLTALRHHTGAPSFVPGMTGMLPLAFPPSHRLANAHRRSVAALSHAVALPAHVLPAAHPALALAAAAFFLFLH